MYAMIGTRPDLSYAVSLLSRFCEAPRVAHWNAVKRVFQYLNGTRSHGICYGARSSSSQTQVGELSCFVDSDYASDVDTRRSVTGYVLNYFYGPIVWKSTKQATVATSTTEAEFVAASQATKDVIWARQLLTEIGQPQRAPTPIFIDNQGAIKLIVNNQIHSKSKHIDVKFMFIREANENKDIVPKYIQTDSQLADIFTKALPREKFIKLRQALVVSTPSSL